MYELGDSAIQQDPIPRHVSIADYFDKVSERYVEPPADVGIHLMYPGIVYNELRSQLLAPDQPKSERLLVEELRQTPGQTAYGQIRDIPSPKSKPDDEAIEAFALGQIELAEMIAKQAGDDRGPEAFIGTPDMSRDALSKAGLKRALEILWERTQGSR